ncbi:MAG: HepT-like ribonuclease domain-containing protein [Acidimicrobiales bacterium]
MTRNDAQRVADIIDAAEKLAARLSLRFEEWLGDEDLRLITERLVEIVGEAARAMSDDAKAAHPSVDWAGFSGLRNVLVHAYHRIQPELLWEAATVDVPALAAALGAEQDQDASWT